MRRWSQGYSIIRGREEGETSRAHRARYGGYSSLITDSLQLYGPLFQAHLTKQMNLTDGCVTQTLDYRADYAENNTIEKGIITKGTRLVRRGQCHA